MNPTAREPTATMRRACRCPRQDLRAADVVRPEPRAYPQLTACAVLACPRRENQGASQRELTQTSALINGVSLPLRPKVDVISASNTDKRSTRRGMPESWLSEAEQRLLAQFQQDLPTSVRPRRRQGQGRYKQFDYRPGPQAPRLPSPRPGTLAAIINDIERCGSTPAAERAMLWAKEFFTPSEVRAWLAAGLRTSDLGLVIDFRKLGIQPEAMTWEVRGGTMLDRIRHDKYSAYEIELVLRNAGLMH